MSVRFGRDTASHGLTVTLTLALGARPPPLGQLFAGSGTGPRGRPEDLEVRGVRSVLDNMQRPPMALRRGLRHRERHHPIVRPQMRSTGPWIRLSSSSGTCLVPSDTRRFIVLFDLLHRGLRALYSSKASYQDERSARRGRVGGSRSVPSRRRATRTPSRRSAALAGRQRPRAVGRGAPPSRRSRTPQQPSTHELTERQMRLPVSRRTRRASRRGKD